MYRREIIILWNFNETIFTYFFKKTQAQAFREILKYIFLINYFFRSNLVLKQYFVADSFDKIMKLYLILHHIWLHLFYVASRTKMNFYSETRHNVQLMILPQVKSPKKIAVRSF